MKIGDMVKLPENLWNIHSGHFVIVTKIDDNGLGFDFVIPEQRGHAPMDFAKFSYGNRDLKILGVKECE